MDICIHQVCSLTYCICILISFLGVPLQDPPSNNNSVQTEPTAVHANRPGTSIRLSDQPLSTGYNNQNSNGCDNSSVGSSNCDITNSYNNHQCTQNSLNSYVQNRQAG